MSELVRKCCLIECALCTSVQSEKGINELAWLLGTEELSPIPIPLKSILYLDLPFQKVSFKRMSKIEDLGLKKDGKHRQIQL